MDCFFFSLFPTHSNFIKSVHTTNFLFLFPLYSAKTQFPKVTVGGCRRGTVGWRVALHEIQANDSHRPHSSIARESRGNIIHVS